MTEETVTNEIKTQLIKQERDIWANTRELWTYRHRVYKRIDNKEGMKSAETELENCEKALDELDKIMAELK